MALRCPRCSVDLAPLERLRDGKKIRLDRCRRCEGVWIDRRELADIDSRLARIREHHEWILAHASRRGVVVCPRCYDALVEFPFFEMHIDYCGKCRGVWLDGNERIGLARALDHELTAIATYRQAATAVVEKMATCGGCKKKVPLDTTLMTAEGVRCVPCFELPLLLNDVNYLELNAAVAAIAVGDCAVCSKRYCEHQ